MPSGNRPEVNLFFISKLKFPYHKYSVDKVWTKIYCHFYFGGIILKQKTIKCLHLSDNEVVNTDEEILKEAKSFYQKLYSSTVSSINNQCDEIFFPLGNIETLTERVQNECGCLLTEAECCESLKSMQPTKSRGTDGLSPEFYKVFWKDMSFYLLNALNHASMKGCLSHSEERNNYFNI